MVLGFSGSQENMVWVREKRRGEVECVRCVAGCKWKGRVSGVDLGLTGKGNKNGVLVLFCGGLKWIGLR